MSRAFVLATLLATALPAQELWVDAINGSNANSGTAAQPLQSITAAIAVVGPQTTVFIRTGVYSIATTNESFPLQMGHGLAHSGVTLMGVGDAVLDLANANGNAIRVGPMAGGGRITNLTIANMDKNDWWATAIAAGTYNGAGSAFGFEIDRCRFIDVNRGVVLWGGTPILGWQIHDNLFIDCGNDGINEFDNGSSNNITNNTFVNNPQLAILNDSNNTVCVNNIFTGCRVGIASSVAPATVPGRMHHNDFWNNTLDVQGAAFPGGTVPAGNLFVDPLFVNAPNRDFHLQATSALLEAGDAGVFLRADIDDNPRAIDNDLDGTLAVDIGAYEAGPLQVSTSVTAGGAILLIDHVTANPAVLTGVILIAFDQGLIQVSGLSPILLDPATLIPFGFAGSFPQQIALAIPPLPAGFRLVTQGFGFAPAAGVVVGGNRAIAWF